MLNYKKKIRKPNNKDIHDYMSIYGTLGLTLALIIITLSINYSVRVVIPKQIEESSMDSERTEIDYKGIMKRMNMTWKSNDPYEIVVVCNNLGNNSEKILENTIIECNNGKILKEKAIKDEEGRCFREIVGEC